MSGWSRGERSRVDAHNQAVYERAEIVREFTELEGLFPCERHLLDSYLAPGANVLDLGVGGGRTIPDLSEASAEYVGLDYSPAMVAACRGRYPGADVRLGDASDLSAFPSGESDFVMFSYNGLDYLHPVAKRDACIGEIARVLRPGGAAVVSSHNARALLRPLPDPSRFAGSRVKARAVQAYATARLALHALPSSAFWKGAGYARDSASANIMYVATPTLMTKDFGAHGLELVEMVGSRYPHPVSNPFEPWIYYAFTKTQDA
jgi:ubiquinone/menaquinone biosynthesis C-methylase UbiE